MIATFGIMIIGASIIELAFFLIGLLPFTVNVFAFGILGIVTLLMQRHYQKYFWQQFKK